MTFDEDIRAIDLAAADGAQPVVHVGERDLADITDDAVAALTVGNQPPTLFRQGNALARVVVGDSDRAVIETHGRTTLRHHLARAAIWRKISHGKEGSRLVATAPPYDVVDDILAAPTWSFPRLDRIVTGPSYAPDGTLRLDPGYHPSGVWHQPGAPIELCFPTRPTSQQIEDACRFLTVELLGDFPFTGDAEVAHAVALLLLPLVRDLIDGPTPLHLVEAPAAGTGKGLLTQLLLRPGLGHLPDAMPDCDSNEEWRKRILTKLKAGGPVLLIDNLTGPLDSGALAAALTNPTFDDRLLGTNRDVSVPVRCVWVATGNNPVLSSEIARRTVRIRLDSSNARPWLRTGFHHPDILRWARQQLTAILNAALTLSQAWLAAGRPDGAQILGSYEDWAHTIGGILDVAGIPGFLGNLDELYEVSDTESQALAAFVAGWWELFQDRPVNAGDLWPIAGKSQPPLPIGDGNERSQRTRFGIWLGQQRDRVIGRRRITPAGIDQRQRVAMWRLTQAGGDQR